MTDSALSRLHILDAHIALRMRDLEARSPTFHDAMDFIRVGTIEVMVGTPELMKESNPIVGTQMAPQHLGEFGALTDSAGIMRTLFVRIDLHRIAELERARQSPLTSWFNHRKQRADFDRLVDAVLIHELWGHLVPVAQAGSMSAKCDDPLPGQHETDSCVMRRENDLRKELGLRPRTTYVLLHD